MINKSSPPYLLPQKMVMVTPLRGAKEDTGSEEKRKMRQEKKKLGLEYKIRKETKSRQRAEKIKMFLRG